MWVFCIHVLLVYFVQRLFCIGILCTCSVGVFCTEVVLSGYFVYMFCWCILYRGCSVWVFCIHVLLVYFIQRLFCVGILYTCSVGVFCTEVVLCGYFVYMFCWCILYRGEQSRREEVSRCKLFVKILFNNKEVSRTGTRFAMIFHPSPSFKCPPHCKQP